MSRADSINNGAKGMRELIKDLGKMAPDLRKEIRAGLAETAQPVVANARARASWSTKIPAATTLKVDSGKNRTGVSLRTNVKKAPHARAYENNGKFGNFRHPVFGHNWWVSQQARPFLWPAAEPWMADVDNNIGNFVDTVSKKYGFN